MPVTDFGGQKYWHNGLVSADLFADSILEVEDRGTEPSVIGGVKYWQNGLPYTDLFKYYTYEETASGGILTGGNGLGRIIFRVTPTGGVLVGGSGGGGVLFTITPSGGILIGGSGLVPETFDLGTISINTDLGQTVFINQRALLSLMINRGVLKTQNINQSILKELGLLDG